MIRLLGAGAAVILLALPASAADKVRNPTCVLDGLSRADRTTIRRFGVIQLTEVTNHRPLPAPDPTTDAAKKREDDLLQDCKRRNGWTEAQYELVARYDITSMALAALEDILAARGVHRAMLDRVWARLTPEDHREFGVMDSSAAIGERAVKLFADEHVTGETVRYGWLYLKDRQQREQAIDALLGDGPAAKDSR